MREVFGWIITISALVILVIGLYFISEPSYKVDTEDYMKAISYLILGFSLLFLGIGLFIIDAIYSLKPKEDKPKV